MCVGTPSCESSDRRDHYSDVIGGMTCVGSQWREGGVLMYVETCEGGALALVTTLFSMFVMYSQIKPISVSTCTTSIHCQEIRDVFVSQAQVHPRNNSVD